jgi:hypothetical protein
MKRLPALLRTAAPLVGLWVVVGAYYAFVVSAGHMTFWPGWSSRYDAQAQALVHGHLHLLERPSRALMTLADPYDSANIKYWRWDHSFYQGHLYMYWGMVPAFLAAAVKLIVPYVFVGDNVLTFAFFMARLIAGTLLIRRVARHAAPRPPRWAVAIAMLVFALANPTPFTLARAAIYEAAIAGGSAFMMIGLCFAYHSWQAPSARAASASLAIASLGFGLAGGSRLNLMPVGVALALLTFAWHGARPRATGQPRRIGLALAALGPAGAVTLALLFINQQRFGAWTEFGRKYVMTFPQLFLSPRFLLPDTYAYAFAPPRLGCAFPYLSAPWDAVRASTPAWLPVSWPVDLYAAEPTLGLLIVAPFVWLSVVAPVVAVVRWRVRRAASSTSTITSASASACTWTWTTRAWLAAALGVWIAGAAPLLIMNMTSMRYQNDFTSPLLLLAILGGWRLLAGPATPAGRRAAAWVYVLLALATVAAGVLLGFGGYFKHFERHNPGLFYALRDHLSLCAGR